MGSGITLAKVSEALGYRGVTAVNEWELGRRSTLPIHRLLLLSRMSGIPAEDLCLDSQLDGLRRLQEAMEETQ